MQTAPVQPRPLSPIDMTMLERVLKSVCAGNAIAGGSADAQRVAALLIREFQLGTSREVDLMSAFGGDGVFKLSVPLSRLSRLMGNGLYGWEDDEGPSKSLGEERIR